MTSLLLFATNLPLACAQSLEVNSGTTTIFSSSWYYGSATVATNAGNRATLEVTTGGSLTAGRIFVGNSGTGTLNVSGGSVWSSTEIYIGRYPGSFGAVTVSSGTLDLYFSDFPGTLYVGYEGTGTLNVTGGLVRDFFGYVSGTASVSGGRWENYDLYSYSGSMLNVTGGYVGCVSGDIYSATVSGGVLEAYSGVFSGVLNVTGGSVRTFNSALYGTATVASGTWAHDHDYSPTAGDMYLLWGAALNVTGGSVTNHSVVLVGGTATVSSGTWASSGDLRVGASTLDSGDGYITDLGSSRTATLTMNGGLVSVAGTLSQGGSGTINLGGSTYYGGSGAINLNAGGTLQIGTGGTSGILDVSSLTNNGTLIFNRSDASTYAGVISGSGAITKQGGGALTLAGANSYSGMTTIAGGTLAISGSGSIGTGGLNLGTTAIPGAFDLAALGSGTYSLPATGNLSGAGLLSGDGKTLAVLGSFLPGNSPSTVTVGTGFTLDLSQSGTSGFEITDPLYTAGTFDLVNGDGSVIFGGILNLNFSGGAYAEGTDVLQLFANSGGRLGNFAGVNAIGLGAGQYATFNPVTGAISVVPEPSTYCMALAGIACAGWEMWRRRKRA